MSLPYFPMYPADFEAKTSHLTLEEDGAYNRLLRLSWMMPGCSLPDDPAWIARRMRVDAATFDRVVAPLLVEFFYRENGRVINPKLTEIHGETNEKHARRVDAGKKGGRPPNALKSNDLVQSNAKAMPKQPEPEPEPYKREIGKPISVQPSEAAMECIAHFNAVAEQAGWPQVQKLTASRKASLSQRISDVGGADAWREAIDRAARSPLLTGQTGGNWRADFDWLCKPANFTKLMEGNYDPRTNVAAIGSHQRGAGGSHDSMVAAFARVARQEPR